MASDNNFVECLVASKASPLMIFLKYLSLTMAIVAFLATMYLGLFGLIFCVLMGVAYYFTSLNSSIEFEYQYCDREITVDKILNKSRRKNVGKYDVGHIDIMAPSRSYHLDDYKNKTLKVLDFSAREKNPQPDPTFTIIYDGKEKLILEPDADFIAAVKNVAPRKVFTD